MVPLLAMLTVPAIAEESVEAVGTEQTSVQKSNPDIKFPHGMQLGLGASVTSGVNGFVGYVNKDFDSFWWKRLGVRFDFASTSPVKSTINSAINSAISDGQDVGDGIAIDNARLSANHYGALVDFYPFGDTWFLGGLRLTGGYIFGKIDLAADLTSNVAGAPTDAMEFELNDVDYRYNGGAITGTADANWKYNGPYLGTGFDLGLFWGIKMYMDAGVVFTNKTARINLDVPITSQLQYWDGLAWQTVQGDSGLTTAFESNKQLALQDANSELDKYKIFPMVKLGFMYRF